MAQRKELTESGEQRAIVEDAVARVFDRRSGDDRRHETPVSSEASEHLRLIARDVVSSHERDCHGLNRLERWNGEMQETINEHSKVLHQYLGEQRFKRFVMPILIGALGSAAGVALMGLLFKGMLIAMAKATP